MNTPASVSQKVGFLLPLNLTQLQKVNFSHWLPAFKNKRCKNVLKYVFVKKECAVTG